MSRRFPRNFEGNARCTLIFPVSVCLRIESKRFVEEETQRKRLGSEVGRIRVGDLPFSGVATKVLALLQMTERYLKWYSPWLSHEFEMLAFGNGGGDLSFRVEFRGAKRSRGISNLNR